MWAFRATSKSTQDRITLAGDLPGPEASVDKIMIAAADQAVFDSARDLLRGDIETDDTARSRAWRREWAYSRAATIYGGTSEIQKDIVAYAAARIAEKRVTVFPRPAPSTRRSGR